MSVIKPPPAPAPQTGHTFLMLDGLSDPKQDGPVLVAFNTVSRLWNDRKGDRVAVSIARQDIARGYINRPFNAVARTLTPESDDLFPTLGKARGDLLFDMELVQVTGYCEETTNWGRAHLSCTPQANLIMPADHMVWICASPKGDKVVFHRSAGFITGYLDMTFPAFLEKLTTRQKQGAAPSWNPN